MEPGGPIMVHLVPSVHSELQTFLTVRHSAVVHLKDPWGFTEPHFENQWAIPQT